MIGFNELCTVLDSFVPIEAHVMFTNDRVCVNCELNGFRHTFWYDYDGNLHVVIKHLTEMTKTSLNEHHLSKEIWLDVQHNIDLKAKLDEVKLYEMCERQTELEQLIKQYKERVENCEIEQIVLTDKIKEMRG